MVDKEADLVVDDVADMVVDEVADMVPAELANMEVFFRPELEQKKTFITTNSISKHGWSDMHYIQLGLPYRLGPCHI